IGARHRRLDRDGCPSRHGADGIPARVAGGSRLQGTADSDGDEPTDGAGDGASDGLEEGAGPDGCDTVSFDRAVTQSTRVGRKSGVKVESSVAYSLGEPVVADWNRWFASGRTTIVDSARACVPSAPARAGAFWSEGTCTSLPPYRARTGTVALRQSGPG